MRWPSDTVKLGAWQPLEIGLREPAVRGLVSETLERVPHELLLGGEYTAVGIGGSVTLRAWPPDAVSERLQDDECAGGQSCEGRAGVLGERCGSRLCAPGADLRREHLPGEPYCAANTHTLVGARFASGNWDTGLNLEPDPQVPLSLGGEVLLVGPEQLDTADTTWNLPVTATFGVYTPLRGVLADVDTVGPGSADDGIGLDLIFPRLPYALVRDGTLTVSQFGSSITLALAPAP